MLNYEEIEKKVIEKLSEKRVYHSRCVVERAIEFAKLYGLENKIEDLKIAGIAHDIAKEIDLDARIEMEKEYGIELDEVEKIDTELIHAKLGSAIAKKDFGCTDEICEAIKWHTTGKVNMSLFEKIIYLADYTSADRKYESCKEVYKIALNSLDEAIIKSMQNTITYLLDKKIMIHTNMIDAYNFLIKTLHNDM